MSTTPHIARAHEPNVSPGRTEFPDVSVIIVNYNVRDFLAQALRSIERASGRLSVEVIVVDNNSVDGSAEMVVRDFPSARLIRNRRNVGFSRANNQAIREAAGRYLFILNPDTILQEDTLQVLVSYLDEHPEAGAAGCQILNPDGSFAPESRRAFPTPTVALYRIVGLSKLFPRSPRFGRYNMTFLPRDQEAEVDALSGSCMLVRHAAVHASQSTWAASSFDERRRIDHGRVTQDDAPGDGAGLFDENFFMYGEDLDWCYRIQQAGWSIRYTPDTRIIHYKGESTKKGDLRYVRLFYGAMLRFIEKHFSPRYSHWFGHLLRFGIMTRASISLLGGAIRRARTPMLDLLVVFACVAAAGLVRAAFADAVVNLSFFLTVAPAYAVAVVLGIAASGGYRPRRRFSARPVLIGAALGLLFVAAGSFFVREIAFSRAVVAFSFVLIVPMLVARRWLGRGLSADARRALLVGSRTEAIRLHHMLRRHPAPPFSLEGYVDPKKRSANRGARGIPRIGTMSQLRDLVRLRRIDNIVFAAEGVSHAQAFSVMQQLRDLPVQFRMLVEGQDHIIGKASVDDLTLPTLLEDERPAGNGRSVIGRRSFEISIALSAILWAPILLLMAPFAGHDGIPRAILRRLPHAPAVLVGRRALVGYTKDSDSDLAVSYGLKPGVFGIMDSWPWSRPSEDERCRAYAFYARHQSASLDCSIMMQSLKTRR